MADKYAKALEIILSSPEPLTRISEHAWSVAGSVPPTRYTVALRDEQSHCTCPAFRYTSWLVSDFGCKHVAVVRIYLKLRGPHRKSYKPPTP